MTLTDIHRTAAPVMGEMSLAITVRKADPADCRRWAETLEESAKALRMFAEVRERLTVTATT